MNLQCITCTHKILLVRARTALSRLSSHTVGGRVTCCPGFEPRDNLSAGPPAPGGGGGGSALGLADLAGVREPACRPGASGGRVVAVA